jgi:formylglycine-generating enzyme required for sulfatase activity
MVGQDGMTLVYIPAGKFRMGSRANDLSSQSDEKPQRSVTLSAFWIDQIEVTNKFYRSCIQAGVCTRQSVIETWDVYHNDSYYGDYPAILVDWENAKAYCEWVGRRLPTEAEWEKAARGPHARIYPWGNEPPASHLLNYGDNIGHPTAVRSYKDGMSPYGAYDMAGNVFEWVSDWYSYDYYRMATSFNPLGPEGGQRHIRRGGSYESSASLVRTANRVNVSQRAGGLADTGFRCALAAPY